MENKYRNIKIIKQAFLAQEVNQDPLMSNICNPSKTLAKTNL
jgi:hypothetical protein